MVDHVRLNELKQVEEPFLRCQLVGAIQELLGGQVRVVA